MRDAKVPLRKRADWRGTSLMRRCPSPSDEANHHHRVALPVDGGALVQIG